MDKETIPLLSDEFLDAVTKEINDLYGFNNPAEAIDFKIQTEEKS